MSWKLASTVRRGTFGKVPPDGNSLGVYPTIKVSWQLRLHSAAQGAGGPHMRGVRRLSVVKVIYANYTNRL
jgi:hypothetical protein